MIQALSFDCSHKPAQFSKKIAKLIIDNQGLPQGTLLNVNVPAVPESETKGIRIVKQSKRAIEERFDKRTDPRDRTYYWFTGEVIESDGLPVRRAWNRQGRGHKNPCPENKRSLIERAMRNLRML